MLGLVPHEHWSIPSYIDKEKARLAREDMASRDIIYGGSESYRHMCRFQSGFFFRQSLLDEYDWYWRVVCFYKGSIDTRNRAPISTVILSMMYSSSWI